MLFLTYVQFFITENSTPKCNNVFGQWMHDTHNFLAYMAMFTKHCFPDMNEISTMVEKNTWNIVSTTTLLLYIIFSLNHKRETTLQKNSQVR